MKNTIVINANENCICDLLSTVDNDENRFLLEIRADTTKNPKLEINNEQIVITGSPFLYEVGSTYYLGSGELTFRVVDDVHTGDYFHITKVAKVDGNLFLNQISNFSYELLYIPARNETGGLTLDKVYPVGSIYISANDNFNPNKVFPGTWESFGKGRTLVGVDTSDIEFQSSEDTGGEKTHVLTVDELPEHNHSASTGGAGKHTHTVGYRKRQDTYGKGTLDAMHWNTGTASTMETSAVANHSHTVTVESTGSGMAHNNMPPYITVRMWKRTA